MSRVTSGAVLLLAAAATSMIVVSTTPRVASLLFVNGTVHTLDPANRVTEAVAILGARVVGTGSSDELRKQFRADTVIDLAGNTVLPGLIDGHAHMNGYGALLHAVLLYGAPSVDEVLRFVAARASSSPPGSWITGRGWDQNLWSAKEFPDAAMLDRVAPDHPVVLIRVDGHAIWVNSRAMEIAGVTAAIPDPAGGKIIRDRDGNPTGIFIEDRARELIESHIPEPTAEEIEANLLAAAGECVRAGLTEVADMGLDSQQIAIYEKLADENRLPLRIYGAISVPSRAWEVWKHRAPLVGRGLFTLRMMKMYADGALGSRGAALVEEYSDDPGNRGTTIESDEELRRETAIALRQGFQPAIHAIGDRANHIALNAYEQVLASLPPGDYRPRIEHVQVLLPEDIPRFAALRVLPSMEPIHATSDMYWAESRLGPKRVLSAYAWRSLLASGSIIISGSDFPNDGLYPLWGIYAAITRSDRNGYPQDGWYREQRMTSEEAVRAYTLWAAYGAFEEHLKGSLEPGKAADLTILSRDILRIPPQEILTTEVVMTIVNGRIVYRKPPALP